MSNASKHYKLVGIHGFCAILAQIIGTDPTGEDIPSFFACMMLSKESRTTASFANCECMVRVTKDCKFDDSLIGFCKGYSQAHSERNCGVSPQNWTHKQTIYAENVEQLPFDSEELKRLRNFKG